MSDSRQRVRHFYTKVAGVTHKNSDGASRQRIIQKCKPLEKLILEHEEDNPVDGNAIKVCRENGQQIGYIRAEWAERFVRESEEGYRYAVFIKEITGGRKVAPSRGVNLLVVVAEPGVTVRESQEYVDNLMLDILQSPSSSHTTKSDSRARLGCLGCLGLLTFGGILLAFMGMGLHHEADRTSQDSVFKEQKQKEQETNQKVPDGSNKPSGRSVPEMPAPMDKHLSQQVVAARFQRAEEGKKPADRHVTNIPPQPARTDSKLNPPSKNNDSDWADATTAVRQGDVQVVINSVVTDQVGFSDVMLLISLSIKNVGKTQKIEYESWSEYDTSHIPSLTDNFGNKYRRITFGLGTRILSANAARNRGVIGSVPGRFVRLSGGEWWPPSEKSIHPGKMIEEDVLGFELPLENIRYLRLELPASAFGGEGKLRFQIPQDMVDRERKKQANGERRQQANARRRKAKAPSEIKQPADAEARQKPEQEAKEEAKRDAARKAKLEEKGLPYYPPPRSLESGHNAEEWCQLLRDNPQNARIYKQATAALSALKEEGIPFLLDYLSSQTTPKSRYDALRVIQVEYVHRNDLHKLLPCLEQQSMNYQSTRLLALQGLEMRAKDLNKDLVPKIESLVEDILKDRRLTEKTQEEIKSRLKTIRLEANSPAANGQH